MTALSGADTVVVTAGCTALTIGAYRLSLAIRKHWTHPLTTPVLLSTALIVVILLIIRMDVQRYEPTKNVLTFFLGPATVALALPLYRHRKLFQKELVPASLGIVCGILVTIATAIAGARLFGLGHALAATLSVKSATAAIAIEIARIVHGDPALAAAIVVCTGTFGAAVGPWVLDRCRVKSPIARGVALGAIAHGIGTAQAATESELAGAVAGVSMGIGAVLTAFAAPLLLRALAG